MTRTPPPPFPRGLGETERKRETERQGREGKRRKRERERDVVFWNASTAAEAASVATALELPTWARQGNSEGYLKPSQGIREAYN